MIELARHFGNDTLLENSEAARRTKWFIKARQDKQLREHLEEKAEDNATALGMAEIIATEEQIRALEIRLASYETATIQALDENRIKLEDIELRLQEVQQRIEIMLQQAHVMEDGRRVFLTEDKSQAFDEHGTDVTRGELDYDAIPPGAPTWEAYSRELRIRDGLKLEQDDLIKDRQAIINYQENLDNTRDRIAEGGMTTEELDDLDAELLEDMPMSVRRHTPGFDTAANAPDLKSSFAKPGDPNPQRLNTSINITPDYSPAG